VLAVGEDRRIAGGGSLLVVGVVIGRALVLARGGTEVAILEQEVGELVVDAGRLGLARERREIGAVPALRLGEVRGLLRPRGLDWYCAW
jgi:hypothetical protein